VALFHGCLAAEGEYIIMGDADGSYDFGDLDLFIQKLEEGFDVVMGNRFRGGIAPGAMSLKNRYVGNPILTGIGRLFFSCPAKDFHCGLRAVRKDAFLRMDLRTTGMEFASEMVIKAQLFQMRIAEVPTTLSKDGRSRPSHLRPWQDGWRHLRFMLLFSPRWLFLIPGLMIFLISMSVYGTLLSGMIYIGSVGFDVHTLFYAEAGMILGALAIAFGVIVRMFGMREGLLRKHAFLDKLLTSHVLEIGGLMGILMIMSGLYWGFFSLHRWSQIDFGALSQEGLLRTVSLSTALIVLGGITLMTSLIMGFLALPTRKHSHLLEFRPK
jgi:hypothetical protein